MKNTENHLLGSLTFCRLGWVEFHIHHRHKVGFAKSTFWTKKKWIFNKVWEYCPSDLNFTQQECWIDENWNCQDFWHLKIVARFMSCSVASASAWFDCCWLFGLERSGPGAKRRTSCFAVSADTLAPLRKQIAKSKEFPMFSIISHLMGLHIATS